MKDIRVDLGEPVPLHEQVAGEIRRAIADGEANPGERLPCLGSVKPIAMRRDRRERPSMSRLKF